MNSKWCYRFVTYWVLLSSQLAFATDVVVQRVEDLNPTGDSVPYGFIEFQDQLYFGANGPDGIELYRTNGQQTEQVANISPTGDSSPSGFVVFDEHLYFAASGDLGRELYRTDGFDTEIVNNIAPSVSSSSPIEMIEYDDWLYFSALPETNGRRELYRTNGVETELIPIDAGIPSSPSSFAVFDDELYFAGTGNAGIEIYKTDGTSVELAADVNAAGDSFPAWLTPYGDRLVFWAMVDDGLEPYELRDSQVRQLADLNPGPADSSPNRFTEFEGNLYFGAHDGSSPEVHRYDGTNITQVQDLNPVEQSENEGFPWDFDVIDGKLYVAAFGENGLDLYSLNKSEDGSESLVLEADTNPVTHSRPVQLTEFSDDVLFISFDEEGFLANEPALYQLNDGEARLVNHHGLGEDLVEPADLTFFSGEIFFRGIGEAGNELYRATLAGDANRDGKVNFVDFLAFASSFRTANPTWETGDFNLDGEVEFGDFLWLSANFGESALSEVAVPEPAAFGCLFLGILIALAQTRNRTR